MIARISLVFTLACSVLLSLAQAADPEPVSVLKGHKGTLSCLAFSRDGKLLASGAKDGTVIVWDFAGRKAAVTIPGHKDMIVAVAFSPDGKTIAATSHDPTVRLYDTMTGKPAGTLIGHTKDARGVAFSNDGKLIATGGVDKTVRLWDATTHKPGPTLEGHTAEVNCVRFSPDSKLLASGGWDKAVRLWDTETGKSVATLEGHTDFVRDLAFTSDSKQLLSSGKDGPVRVWDIEKRKLAKTLEGHNGLVRSLALSPDDKWLDEAVNFFTMITLTEREGKTEVTLRMAFPSAAERDEVAQKYGAIERAHQTLARLGEHLAAATPAEEFVITRTFDAPRDLVFKAWTEADRLAKWWGPKGFTLLACKLDLRPGGVFFYGGKAPHGGEMWGKWVFREVVPPERLMFVVSFADERGNTIRAPFSADWPLEVLSTVTFTEQAGKTTLTMRGVPINATEAERAAFAGMRDSMTGGWTGTFDQLAAFLAQE